MIEKVVAVLAAVCVVAVTVAELAGTDGAFGQAGQSPRTALAGGGYAGLPRAPVSQTGAPTVTSTSSAEFTATINPQGLPTTMHFEYSVNLPVATTAAVTVGSQTPEQPVGSDFADHNVTATAADLLPNSTYLVRAVAVNASGSTPGRDATFKTAADPPPPPPVLGKSVDAVPVSGIVYVLLPGKGHISGASSALVKGAGFIPLTEARQFPVGTIFDTTGGVVRLMSATGVRGKVQTGDFGAGLFKILQNRRERGVTEVSLIVRSSARKTCATAGRKAHTAAKRKLLQAVLTLVRADVKGRFRTRGRNSSAIVRGTAWTTSDRCDGTLTAVKRGVVVVTDFRLKRQIVLRAGRSYLAKAA
ncbi:MAG: hypothetical protein QOF55_2158 [Thermoleophilaceae bacterium]|jgi:hypothetical protein|nr:hypothetical protein [Thermoleophilaceae bacterium]